MFHGNGNLEPPKYVKRSRPQAMKFDLQIPALEPGLYGHYAREPNTDYHVRVLEYKQKLRDADNQFLAKEAKHFMQNAVTAKYDKHIEKCVFKRHIQERFKEKVKAYEQTIDERREKLRVLLCQEEKDFIAETVDQCQKGAATKLENMKLRAEQLKAAREVQRLEVVKQKRIQQYINDCTDLRPVLFKRNLIDSKMSHLQQIKEKEMREEAEKEINHMWHLMMVKEAQSRMAREEEEALNKHMTKNALLESWDKQQAGKKLMKQESERIAAEDRLEMIKLQEQIRREEIEALDAKARKRDKIAIELLEQIAVQEQLAAQRKKEEQAIDQAMDHLANIEVEKEKQKMQSSSMQARKETAIYRNYLKGLDIERKREEKDLADLLEMHRKAVQQKLDDAKCKIKLAREALRKSVLEGRAQQLADKRLEAENQLKLQEAENELIRMACETNERLQAETDRLQAEQVREYREDLKKQIEMNNEKRRHEKEELERELAEGLAEEERRRKICEEVTGTRLEAITFKHPFGRVLDKRYLESCPCLPGQ